MKKAFPIVIAILVLLGVGAFVASIFFQRERQYHKVEIPVSYLETADTSRYSVQPVALGRSFPDDSILVFFPVNEQGAQVYLYDQKNYNRLLFGDHRGMPLSQPNSRGYAALFGRPVINLSNFAQGKYYVHVTSCNFGGFFEIELKDSVQ